MARFPNVEFRLHQTGGVRLGPPLLQSVQEKIGAFVPDVVHVLGHAAQSNEATYFNVVVPNKGKVVGHLKSFFAECLPGPDGLYVAARKGGLHRVVEGQEVLHRLVPGLLAEPIVLARVAVHHEVGIELNARVFQRPAVPRDPLVADTVVVGRRDGPDPGVVLVDEVIDCELGTGLVLPVERIEAGQLGPGEHGLAGIRALADDLPTWTYLPDPGWTVRFAYQNVERRGTGGGCFRRMYADFLDTASEALPAVPAEAGERMHGIADDWTAAGETLKAASECEDTGEMQPLLDDAAAAIHDLADREERLFAELGAALE